MPSKKRRPKPWTFITLATLLTLGIAAAALSLAQWYPTPQQFEGVIIEKKSYAMNVVYRGHLQRVVIIKTQSGKELSIAVDEELFLRAAPGMVLRRDGPGSKMTLETSLGTRVL